ncbi:unnamed protein product [Calypogeia fissa]
MASSFSSSPPLCKSRTITSTTTTPTTTVASFTLLNSRNSSSSIRWTLFTVQQLPTSSSSSLSTFSASTCGFHGVLSHGRKFSIRGPVAPRGRGGGGGRLPGTGPEWPPKSHISPPGLGQFRPPPSTFVRNYEESEDERQNADIKKTLLMEKLTAGQGSWQERAGFVKELQQLGVTSEDLYNQTFVPIVHQLEMIVAAQVYESLVQSGTAQEVLQCFDESSLSLLYGLRTLSARQRRAAAEYVIENALSVEEAQKLAWAIKDHERRPTGRNGFTTAPGDCLAFMYHRQAIETQDGEQKQITVEQGLKVAVTDSAKQRFSEF